MPHCWKIISKHISCVINAANTSIDFPRCQQHACISMRLYIICATDKWLWNKPHQTIKKNGVKPSSQRACESRWYWAFHEWTWHAWCLSWWSGNEFPEQIPKLSGSTSLSKQHSALMHIHITSKILYVLIYCIYYYSIYLICIFKLPTDVTVLLISSGNTEAILSISK